MVEVVEELVDRRGSHDEDEGKNGEDEIDYYSLMTSVLSNM